MIILDFIYVRCIGCRNSQSIPFLSHFADLLEHRFYCIVVELIVAYVLLVLIVYVLLVIVNFVLLIRQSPATFQQLIETLVFTISIPAASIIV